MRGIWVVTGVVAIISLAILECKSTSPAAIIPVPIDTVSVDSLEIIPGPQLAISVDSIDGIPNTPDAITQATPVPLSLRMHVEPLADSTDTVKILHLNTGDGQAKQWTGIQIPIGSDFPYSSWWVRAGLCTVKVAATTAKGDVSDTSIVCRVLTRDEYDAAFAKRVASRPSRK